MAFVAKDYPMWSSFPELKELSLGDLLEQRQYWYAQKSQAEQELNALNQQIAGALAIIDQKSVRWQDGEGKTFTITYVNGRSPSRLDAKLLLANGVEAEVIQSCTVPGSEYVTVKMSEVKQYTESGEDS